MNISSLTSAQITTIVCSLYPSAEIKGTEAFIGSLAGESGQSLSICLKDGQGGKWIERNGGTKGNIFTLVKEAKGIDGNGAYQYLEDILGIAQEPMKKRTKAILRINDKKLIEKGLSIVTDSVPTMGQPLPLSFSNKNENTPRYILLLPDSVYQYKNYNGQILGYVYRYEAKTLQKADGKAKKKAQVPVTYFSDGNWYAKGLPSYPFYGSERIRNSNGTYLFSEGEKCTDLASLAFPWITSLSTQGGSNGFGKDGERLLLEEKTIDALKTGKVFVLPDKDAAGIYYAKQLKSLLEAKGIIVTILSIVFIEQRLGITLEDGADIEQLIAAGLTEEYLNEWMAYPNNNKDFELLENNLSSKSAQNEGNSSDLKNLKEKEKPVYIANLIISMIETSFNKKDTNSSYLKLKADPRPYKCGDREFYVKIAGIYSQAFRESTNKYKEISNLVEHYLKDQKNGVIWVESSKPVLLKDNKVYFKTDLIGYPIYEIDANGFRISSEKDYCAYTTLFAKDSEKIVFKLADEPASTKQLEFFFSVKGVDLVKILAFCMSSIFSNEKYILGIFGKFSSGKDYVQTRIQEIISPLESFNRVLPNNKRDLMVVSSKTFINGYTNLSFLPKDFQDYFCSLVGDVSDPSRKLFSDDSVVEVHAQTAIIMNGINNVVDRADLLSRMMVINLEPINHESRVKFIGSLKELKTLQGKVQNFVFNLISRLIADIDKIHQCLIGKNRQEKILSWMELCIKYAELNVSFEKVIEEQQAEQLNNILENPVYMAIENYFEKISTNRIAGGITEVWQTIKNFSDLGYLGNIGPNGFMKEINRIDFSKTPISFIKSGRPRISSSTVKQTRSNQICFELKENNDA